MSTPGLRETSKKQEAWKKGDRAISQSQVYSKLPEGYFVYFYQEGQVGTSSFIIEIAMNPLPWKEFFAKREEIRAEVERNSRGRKFCMFNL